jgi:uncharacterized protein (TIGR00251 family)
MTERKYHLHNGQRGAALAVRVTPRSRKNEIVEILDNGTVKIRLTAPPVEGKANDALIAFLAEVIDVPRSQIDIIAGATGREKLVSILNMDAETVHRRILAHLS